MERIDSANIACLDSDIRSNYLKTHIPLTFVYRGIAVGFSFLLVPITINYLNIELYGIWMTLLSIMSWITFFDIGLGNGMRNKLAEALAVKDIKLSRTYVSNAYAGIGLIALLFFVVLICSNPFIQWNKVFNTVSISGSQLSKLVLIIGFFFLLNFVLSLCNQVFYAHQKASLPALNQGLMNFFAVLTVYCLTVFTSGNLIYLGAGYGFSMVLSQVILSFYFFRKHKLVIPAAGYFDSGKMRDITSLGVNFFIIQIAVLIIFATDNIIITQILGPEAVVPYNIVFKLFSIITLIHGIIVSALWSAYTDAYAKGDFNWIRNSLKKMNILMIPIIISVLLLIIFAKGIIKIWVGPQIKVPDLLVILMGIFIIVSSWNNIYGYFINGVGKIKPQMYLAVFGGLINIPLSVYFAKYLGLGNSGVILGTIVTLLFSSIVIPVQTYFILKR